eukprot:scaffold39791_cov60-Phaeocystis_antarctica.AAC.1
MQEDLRLVRAPAALGAAVAAAAPCAARSRLQRLQRQEEVQDQDHEMQEEASEFHDEVREEMQEGRQEEEAAVPEGLLRSRLPRLNGPLEALVVANRPVSDPGWRWSNVPLGLKKSGRGSREGKAAKYIRGGERVCLSTPRGMPHDS